MSTDTDTDLDDLEARVTGALDDLEAQSDLTAEDLDRFRRALPTDPTLAMLVDRWLPPPWDEVFEYVQGSDRQAAYWRTRRDRSPQSPAEHERNERFREAARRSTGVRGTTDHDGAEIPASAKITADVVAGSTTSRTRAAESGRKALRRLRSVLGLDEVA